MSGSFVPKCKETILYRFGVKKNFEVTMGIILFFGVLAFIAFYFFNGAYNDLKNREKEINKITQEKIQYIVKLESKQKEEHKKLTQNVKELENYIENKRKELSLEKEAWEEEKERLLSETRDLISSFNDGFIKGRTWLAEAFSEYLNLKDLEVECALVVKPNSAWKSSEIVSEIRKSRNKMAKELKLLEYQIASYEEYFPFLSEYRDAILDELVDMRNEVEEEMLEIDPALALGYLSREEYLKLPNTVKFQKALDRYWEKDKSKIEIGRLYERYVGYLYERDGWRVRFEGALKGFEDFGRDLICKKGNKTEIVQCKCWSQHRVIREKHIMQLFGTTILYRITENIRDVEPIFATTTELSEEAKMVAKELRIKVVEKKLERYPMIKCNINPSSKEKIYHLPFDQQYDRVVIGNAEGELYAETIEEAENAGFRRAFKWKGGEIQE
jgi:uncharacterized protein YlxW (UPF0749 family)